MEAWLSQYFLNPGLVVGGTALVASPIIIHLINRLRYRRVRFAAMEFLLQSQQRNRRRVLLEQMLLLLMRILIVLVLVALVARLVLDPNQLSIFRGGQTHHVVVLDDSGSMRDRWGETSAFLEARTLVRQIAAEGARRPGTQRFSLLLLSKPGAPLFIQRDVTEDFVTELEVKLSNLGCSHRRGDLTAALEACHDLLQDDRSIVKHVHLLSDYRQSDWVGQKALAGLVRQLDSAGVSVNLVKTVPLRNANLAVQSLSGDVQIAVAGVPVRLRTVVKNFGETVAEHVPVSVVVDGRKLPLNVVIDKIEPNAEIASEFDVVFSEARKHKIRVNLPADALVEDNTRYLAVDVRASNPVLIVDGNPTGDEAFYLQTALSPEGALTGFAPRVETVEFLRKKRLDEFQTVVMLNVAELPVDAVGPLEQFVADGGGLMWYLGNAIKPLYYSERLYDKGKGLFPVRIAAAPRQMAAETSATAPDLSVTDHPVFAVFAGQDNPLIESVKINYFYPLEEGFAERLAADRRVKVIARLRNGSPLMLEHMFGAGRVLTSLTSCGPLMAADDVEWTNWVRNPSFIVTQLEIQKYLAPRNRVLEKRTVGEPIEVRLDPLRFTDRVEILVPDETGERVTRLNAAPASLPEKEAAADPVDSADTEAAEAVELTAVYSDTDLPGIYVVRLTDLEQLPHEELLAYNFPLAESELEIITTAKLRKQIGEDVHCRIQEPGQYQWIQGREAGQELRRLLLMALLIFLSVEQLLAHRLSYVPRSEEVSA